MERILPAYRVSLRIEDRLNKIERKSNKSSEKLEIRTMKHLNRIEQKNEELLAKIEDRLNKIERKSDKSSEKLERRLINVEKALKSQRILSHNLFFLEQSTNTKSIQQARAEYFMSMPKAEGDLRVVQEVGIYLLKNFKKLCIENNLQYWLESGTLIGAMRHHGFVPWDDDIDLGMSRHDLDKLRSVLQNNSEFKMADIYYTSKKDGRKSMTTKFSFRDMKMPISIDLNTYDFLNVDDLSAGWKMRYDLREKFSKEIEQIESKLNNTFSLEEINNEDDLNLIQPIMNKYTALASEFREGNVMCLAFHKFVRWKWIFPTDVFFPLAEEMFEGEKYPIPNRPIEHLRLQHNDIYEFADSLGKSKKINKYKLTADINYQVNYLQEKGHYLKY